MMISSNKVDKGKLGLEAVRPSKLSEFDHTRTVHRRRSRNAALCATFLLSSMPIAQENAISSSDSNPSTGAVISDTKQLIPALGDHANAFDGIVALYETLDGAREEELSELMHQSLDVVHLSVRHDIQFAIASRFAAINPQEALAESLRYPLPDRAAFVEGAFAEWSEIDLDDAVAAATSLDRELRLVALESITAVRDDLTALELREIASQLGHVDYALLVESESVVNRFADDPVELWHVLVQDGLGDALRHDFSVRKQDGLKNAPQLDALIRVAESTIEQEGLATLFLLKASIVHFEHYSGLYEESNKILDTVVDALVSNDPQQTWNYIQNGYAKVSPDLLEEKEEEGVGGESERDQAFKRMIVQELLLKSWAALDPAVVLERIDQIPNELRVLACEWALPALAATNPQRAIELTQELKHHGANRYEAVKGIVEQWSTVDASAALAWVMSSSNNEHTPARKQDLLRQVLNSLVLKEPDRALQLAMQQPSTDVLEARVIAHLAEFDLESAVMLLPMIKTKAYGAAIDWVADRLIRRGEVDRAIELYSPYVESLGDSDEWFWFFLELSRENPIQLFERLDDMSPKMRREGARALCHYSDPVLTQEQLDYARAILEEGEP